LRKGVDEMNISIEQVENGYIMRFCDDDVHRTLVKQAEFDSMNLALAAVCKELVEWWQDEDEVIRVKLEASP
jgi:hypothetical protein